MQGAMDLFIRNVDEETYRRFKARAVLDDRTVGDALNEAMREHLAGRRRRVTLKPEPRLA